MKLTGIGPVCALAALGLVSAAVAQEGSKIASSAGDTDLADLISRYAKRSGKKFIIDPRVRAQVPLAGIGPGDITHDQLLTILDVHQFVMIPSGDVYLVVPDAGARQLPTAVYTDLNFKAPDHEIISLLITPKKTCAAFMVPVLRPLMPQAAHLAAEVQTNSLIINDRAGNVRRIAEMVEQLVSGGAGKQDCTPPASQPAAPRAGS